MVSGKNKIILVLIGLLALAVSGNIGLAASKAKTASPLTVCMQNWGLSTEPAMQEAVKNYMEKQSGVKIKMIVIPENSYSEKLPVLLASGDIPDIFRINKAMVNVQAFTMRGYTADIDALVKKNKLCQKLNPKYFNYMRVNGKIHAIPRDKEQEKFIWARGDLLDKYGVKLSSTPTTEEFYKEMSKVKGIIPLSISKFLDNLPFFYSSFGAYDEFTKNSKGKYFDTFDTQEMRECLKYMNRLYEGGILDKEFPTNDNSVVRNNLISGKSAANFDYDNRFFYYNSEIARLDPNAKPDLRPIFKLVGPKGQGGTLNEAIQDAYAVGSKCKRPKDAVGLISWMVLTADGIKAIRFGLPKLHYVVNDGVIALTPQAERGGMPLAPTGLLKQFVDYDDLNLGFKFPTDELNGIYNKNIAQQVGKHTGPKHVVPAGASSIYDRIGPSLIKKRQELALKMILGTVTIENGYKEYEDYFKSINGAQILKELNTKH